MVIGIVLTFICEDVVLLLVVLDSVVEDTMDNKVVTKLSASVLLVLLGRVVMRAVVKKKGLYHKI